MSQQIKTPKGVIITLMAGFGLGAITMAGIHSGAIIPSAFAQNPAVGGFHTAAGESTESIAELHNLDTSFADLAQFVEPAVVDIRASSGREMNVNGQRVAQRQGEGSGFIFRSDGYILTNDHVVDGADSVKVILQDGKEYDGKVTRAEQSDLAVVKIEAKGLPVLAFGDSSKIKPGEMCMAVGSPFGMENSVTFGHISALGRATPIASELQERYYPDLIQTDASINMGNSGGPLVNVDGQVVGINTAIYSPSGTSAGIGFAIPSNQAKFIADMLIDKGKVTRAMIGLVPDNLKEYEKKEKGLTGGAVVSEVQPDSPAERAGLKKDDIIVKIGSTPITSQLDLRNAMLIYSAGTTVPVEYIRDGKNGTVDVKLEAYKEPKQPTLQQLQPGDDGQDQLDIPKLFDDPDLKTFKQFRDRLKQQDGGQQQGDSSSAQPGDPAHLGVQIGSTTDEMRSEFNIPKSVSGAVVVTVQPGSVADRLGLKPGDVVTLLGGKKIGSAQDLSDAIKDYKVGDSAKIGYSHYSQTGVTTEERTINF